jgi:pyruvate-formate lyase
MLRDAINHPDQYADLTIRVTGYSARFVQLARELQEEIAARESF